MWIARCDRYDNSAKSCIVHSVSDSMADETLGVEMGKEETEDFNASQEWQEIEDQGMLIPINKNCLRVIVC